MAGTVKNFIKNHRSIVDDFNKYCQKHPFISGVFDYGSGGTMFVGLNTLAVTMNAPVLGTIAAVVLLATLATGGMLPGFVSKHSIAGTLAAGKTVKDKLLSTKGTSPSH